MSEMLQFYYKHKTENARKLESTILEKKETSNEDYENKNELKEDQKMLIKSLKKKMDAGAIR